MLFVYYNIKLNAELDVPTVSLGIDLELCTCVMSKGCCRWYSDIHTGIYVVKYKQEKNDLVVNMCAYTRNLTGCCSECTRTKTV